MAQVVWKAARVGSRRKPAKIPSPQSATAIKKRRGSVPGRMAKAVRSTARAQAQKGMMTFREPGRVRLASNRPAISKKARKSVDNQAFSREEG
jgi:hypothetical protein